MITQCGEPGCEVTLNDTAPQGWHWELVHGFPYHRTRLRRNKKEAEDDE